MENGTLTLGLILPGVMMKNLPHTSLTHFFSLQELTDNRTAQSSEIETDEMTECDSSRPLFRMPPDRSTFSPVSF